MEWQVAATLYAIVDNLKALDVLSYFAPGIVGILVLSARPATIFLSTWALARSGRPVRVEYEGRHPRLRLVIQIDHKQEEK